MQKNDNIQTQVAKKIQECLRELGFEPEMQVSAHEGVVAARRQMDDKCIRVVAHITDREPSTFDFGRASAEMAKVRRAQVAIRPSLANRSASRTASDTEAENECQK
jgi:hypothetical protein